MNRTEQTLLEQMRISAVEITNRLELLRLDPESLHLLSTKRDIIQAQIDEIVDEFYNRQTATDDIAMLIGDADTLQRLKVAQRRYILDLFSGKYDSDYVNNRLRIGLVHKRIGVEPKLYLSAVYCLKEILYKVFRNTIQQKGELQECLQILDKLLYFDTTLVFDTYIDSLLAEIRTVKKQTEKYAHSLEDKVAERTRQLERETQTDPLTHIYNRRAMYHILQKELAFAKRRATTLSLIYFDLDGFKDINDQLGHLQGDEVLKHVANVLRNSVRETDVACRYGGDEFCLILPDCDKNEAKLISKKIIDGYSQKYPDYSLSMGIAQSSPEKSLDQDQLIKAADNKMYEAKKDQGNQIKS